MVNSQIAEGLRYHPRLHAYQRTNEYLFSQLIPYIGSKRRLLGLIDRAVKRTGVSQGTFADLFAGSGVVSRYAKLSGFRVVANDWEPYSNVLNSAAISLNTPPCGAEYFEKLNSLDGVDGYITTNYCPKNDDSADPLRERMYYTRANGRKIDAIRSQIARWSDDGEITAAQANYLLAPLISAASYTANTSGVFKAYHRGWGGSTNTAHYRILSDLKLSPMVLTDNHETNLTLSLDATDLACNWRIHAGSEPEITYLDPPYNQHPYGSNYHLLNSIALWDCPAVPDIQLAKSAIRTDWRTDRRSSFNSTSQALPALIKLLDSISCRWVLLSYSTDGNIPLRDLIRAFVDRGAVAVVADNYKRYRVSTQRMSERSHNVEFVLILDKLARPITSAEAVLAEIDNAADLLPES